MANLTWRELRKVLVDCGDEDAVMNEAVILRNSEGAFHMDIVVDARAGTLAFIDALMPDETDGE